MPARPRLAARFCLAACLLLSLALPALAEDAPLPAPPEGFRWQHLEPVKANFLLPEGWFYRQEVNQGTLAYFITETEIVEGALFDTGLSINVIPQASQRTGGIAAPDYARAYIAQCSKTYAGSIAWQFEQDMFRGYGCEFSTEPQPGARITMHTLAIGNVDTDTLYILWFESPAEEWAVAWQTGERLMSLFSLEDTY